MSRRNARPGLFVFVALSFTAADWAWSVPVVFSAAGADPLSIQPTVDDFRNALGAQNPNLPGSFGAGRREINWDGVPEAFSSPGAFPGDFFNAPLAGRARGVVFSTPGTELQVSAASPGPVEFDDINPTYSSLFDVFSPEKLFTAVGSNVTDVQFFVPGSNVSAGVRGFGAVFTDVDSSTSTSIQYFDVDDVSLGQFFVSPEDLGLSFLGVFFDAGELVGRVRITSGNTALGPNDVPGATDVVVMDDFIYGEPVNVPEPGVPALLGLVMLAIAAIRLRR